MSAETSYDTRASSTPGGDRVQDAANDLLTQAGRTADAQASQTMTQVGDTLGQVAEAFRGVGSDMSSDRPEIANAASTLANQIDRAATYLRGHDASETLEAATDFARRQPALVIGGALLAGLALGRFLRSAAETQEVRSSGSRRSRLRSGTYAGMSSPYGSSDGSDGSRYDADESERLLPSSTTFENRTSELEGSSSSTADAGTSAAAKSRKRTSSASSSNGASSSRNASSRGS